MATNRYRCWHMTDSTKITPNQMVDAETSFEARKIYANLVRKPVAEIMARRQDPAVRAFSDGTAIRSEP